MKYKFFLYQESKHSTGFVLTVSYNLFSNRMPKYSHLLTNFGDAEGNISGNYKNQLHSTSASRKY